MAAWEEKISRDFYAVLGLKKECSATDLRHAYKKLALRWHPDRCSASGNSKFVEEAKKKFQAIHEAYTVLSDANKRFLYDVGAYDSDDDENGMGDFLGEMAMMMNQTKPTIQGNAKEGFEELQELFEEMFQRDVKGFGMSSQACNVQCKASCYSSISGRSNINKRNGSDISSGISKGTDGRLSSFDFSYVLEGDCSFCVGAEDGEESRNKSSRGSRRKQKVSSRRDRMSSSSDAKISA